MTVFEQFTVLDIVAIAFFLVGWIGYGPFLRWRGRGKQTAASSMLDHRRAWMEGLLGREMKIADTAIVGHIMSTASFFASTTVIVIGALLGVLINLGRSTPGARSDWLSIGEPSLLELKVLLIVVIAVYAFQSFSWAIRQANFAAVMMGAAPPPAATDAALRGRIATSMGNIITGVAESYDSGVRSYFFAFAAITWIVSPVALILATVLVVWLLLYRQTRSRTAIALKELANARLESSAPAGNKPSGTA